MKDNLEKNDTKDIEKIKIFLKTLGFVCSSDLSAQHRIYTKSGDTVVIKNSKSYKE